MGCDIHAMIEARYRYEYLPGVWSWQSCGELRISRDYTLFARLADVRNDGKAVPIAKPRFDTIVDDTDDEVCSETFKLHSLAYGIAGHSHSWVTLDELQTADAELAERCRLIVMAHGLSTTDARLVFFFDH